MGTTMAPASIVKPDNFHVHAPKHLVYAVGIVFGRWVRWARNSLFCWRACTFMIPFRVSSCELQVFITTHLYKCEPCSAFSWKNHRQRLRSWRISSPLFLVLS